MASSTLRSLHLLLYEDKSIITNKLVDIVEIVRKFVFYNINPTTYKHSKDDTLMNSMQMLPHQQRLSHLRQQEQNKRLSTLIPFNNLSANKEFGLVSSDSEISDSEAINPGSRKHRDNAKIRINALLCLQAIAKVRHFVCQLGSLSILLTLSRPPLGHFIHTGRTLYHIISTHLFISTE